MPTLEESIETLERRQDRLITRQVKTRSRIVELYQMLRMMANNGILPRTALPIFNRASKEAESDDV